MTDCPVFSDRDVFCEFCGFYRGIVKVVVSYIWKELPAFITNDQVGQRGPLKMETENFFELRELITEKCKFLLQNSEISKQEFVFKTSSLVISFTYLLHGAESFLRS
jgi:hypothetical protein